MFPGAQILPYCGIMPSIHPSAFIAPGAVVVGDVEIGAQSGVWFNCVIRGDVQSIRIGERTNIQDGSVIHVTRVTGPTHIGSGVTIGHMALLHACTVEDDSFIGMGAALLDGAHVHRHGMVAAKALITPRKQVGAGELWGGNPGKLMRELSEAEIAFFAQSAENYVQLAAQYLAPDIG